MISTGRDTKQTHGRRRYQSASHLFVLKVMYKSMLVILIIFIQDNSEWELDLQLDNVGRRLTPTHQTILSISFWTCALNSFSH